MVRILIDTCVISEVQRQQGDPRVRAAFDRLASDDIYFSVITIGEIALLDPGRRRTSLEAWLFDIETVYGDRILPIDLEVARIWGQESARNLRSGRVVSDADALITATAIRHRLPIMTRNVRHFHGTGPGIIDPWED